MQGAAGAESCLARGRNGGLLHPGLGQTQLATGGRKVASAGSLPKNMFNPPKGGATLSEEQLSSLMEEISVPRGTGKQHCIPES